MIMHSSAAAASSVQFLWHVCFDWLTVPFRQRNLPSAVQAFTPPLLPEQGVLRASATTFVAKLAMIVSTTTPIRISILSICCGVGLFNQQIGPSSGIRLARAADGVSGLTKIFAGQAIAIAVELRCATVIEAPDGFLAGCHVFAIAIRA